MTNLCIVSLASPCSSAFRRTFSTFSLFSQFPRRTATWYVLSAPIFPKTWLLQPLPYKTSAQGFPMCTDMITRMRYIHHSQGRSLGKVCLKRVVNLGWFLYILLLYWNWIHWPTMNRPEGRAFSGLKAKRKYNWPQKLVPDGPHSSQLAELAFSPALSQTLKKALQLDFPVLVAK